MNKKSILAIALLLTTALIGGAAVFIGIYLKQETVTPQDIQAEIPSWCVPVPGGRCACYDGINCCNGDGTYCSGETCNNECVFINVDETECALGLMTYCNYDMADDGVTCVDAPLECECDCDTNIPEPNDGETEIYHGTNATYCNDAERVVRYDSICDSCNNVYFCIACFETLEITETPTTTPTISITSTPTISITSTPTTTLTPSISRSPSVSPSPSGTITTTPTLPTTAIFDSGIDVIILGILLISSGVILYRSGAYIKIGDLYWDGAGKNLSQGFNDTNSMISNILDNIGLGLIHIDRTLLYFFHQMSVQTKLTIMLVYNNMVLIKEQIITAILTIISKLLNLLIFITIRAKLLIFKIKGLIRTIGIVIRSTFISSKNIVSSTSTKIIKRTKRMKGSFEDKVIDDREDKLD